MKKEAYYFSHDANARNDVKCIKLRRELGLEGYGIFWCLIEILREAPEHKLPLASIEDIAFDLHTTKEKLEAVVLRYDLFQIEHDVFFSLRLNRSMTQYNDKKKLLSEAGMKGNAIRWRSGSDRVAIAPQSQLKERKVNKNKRDNNKKEGFIPPSIDDVIAYFKENGYTEEGAKKAYEHYQLANWHDARGNKVLNWKQKMHTNWFKEEYKIKAAPVTPLFPETDNPMVRLKKLNS